MSVVATHTDTRTIYLGDSIDTESTGEVIQGLIDLSSQSSEPITLLINSTGGAADDGLAIYDAIKACIVPVDGLVLGACWSAAGLVLQGCRNRLISKHSTFMVHAGTIAVHRVHALEAKTEAKEHFRSHDVFDSIIAERAGMPLRKFRALSRFGTYFTAEEAVKHGFADQVISAGSGFNGGK